MSGMSSATASPTADEIKAFRARCEPHGDCLIWTGQKDRDGYGIVGFRRATRKAHRLALWLAGRPIPEGHVVNHTCRRRDCVNPQHLTTLTASENSKRDSTSMGYINSQKTHCKNGHPFDRVYGGQRYCSTCESEKTKRLRAKWKAEGILKI
jgi:hypothetical protein